MDFAQFKDEATRFLQGSDHNYVKQEDALRDDLVGMRIFAEPLFGVASADDSLFAQLRYPEAVHPDYCLPHQWLPEAKSVIACFLPFSQKIKKANAVDLSTPADEWLHGRIEG
ncbi:MAG: epoxyqueuosine reductase, partial [Firmicutes bacterium]|nr:epoxyqueuosine reductase [Bacillota bacterium]